MSSDKRHLTPDGTLVAPFSVWRHLKTKLSYTVFALVPYSDIVPQSNELLLGIARCSTNGKNEGEDAVLFVTSYGTVLLHGRPGVFKAGDVAVVYHSHTTGRLYHRDWKQYLDGRFQREC